MPLSSTSRRALLGAALLLTFSCGGGDGGGTEPTPNPTPSITTIVRDTATAGVTPFSVSLGGADFMPGVVATFDGNARSTNRLSGSGLTFLLQAADLASAGDHEIRLKNPEPGGGPSAPTLFHVLPQPPVPVLDSLSPDSVVAGTAGPLTVKVFGHGLVPGAVLRIDGFAVVATRVSDTLLQTQLATGTLSSAAVKTFSVFKQGPGGGTSDPKTFIVAPRPPAPQITATLPVTVVVGPDTATLQVIGTTFRNLDSVTFASNAQVRRVTPMSATDTTLTLPLDRTWLSAANELSIRVYTAWGTSGSFVVQVHNPAPAITSVHPDTVDGSRTEDTVYVKGSGFVTGMHVYVSGIPAKATTVLAPDSIRAIIGAIPLLLGGIHPLAVFDPIEGVMSDSIDIGIRSPVPTLDSIAGAQMDSVGSQPSLVLWGSGFRGNGEVLVNGVIHTPTAFAIDRVYFDLTAEDTDSTGSLAIAYRTPGPGGGTTASLPFQIVPPNPTPIVDSSDRTFVPADSGTVVVTLYGHGFVTGDKIQRTIENSSQLVDTLSATVLNDSTLTFDFVVPPALDGVSYAIRVVAPAPSSQPSTALRLLLGGTQVTSLKELPRGVARLVADPTRARLYGLASTGNGKIYAIDPVAASIVDSTTVGGGALALAVSSDGSVLYIATYASGVVKLDPVTLDSIGVIPMGVTPDSVQWGITTIAAARSHPGRIGVVRAPTSGSTSGFQVVLVEGDSILPAKVDIPLAELGSTLAFAPNDDELDAVTASTNPAHFRRMAVSSTGLTLSLDATNGIGAAQQMQVIENFIAVTAFGNLGDSNLGELIHTTTGSYLATLGGYDALVVGPSRGDSTAYLAELRPETGSPIYYVTAMGINGTVGGIKFPSIAIGALRDVAVWGPDGFAVAGSTGISIGRSSQTVR